MSDHRKSFDARAYVSIDHGLPENSKVVGLSDKAFRLYIEAICYCSRQQSDGRITDAAMRRMGRPRDAVECLEAGLFDQYGTGWEVHDYLRHQRSAEEIAAIREGKADNGNKGAHVRWHLARRRFDDKCEWCLKEVGSAQSA